MSEAAQHIAAWEAAGLIDGPTADRLRAHDADGVGLAGTADAPASTPTIADAGPAGRHPSSPAIFGPGLIIGEMFGYVGASISCSRRGRNSSSALPASAHRRASSSSPPDPG